MTKPTISIEAFLADMEDADFPTFAGPWRTFDHFDPPFRLRDLRAMDRRGAINLDEGGKRFRLTMLATDVRDRIKRERAKALSELAALDGEHI